MVNEPPRACDIEIIERVHGKPAAGECAGQGVGIVIPNEIRINGHPVLAPNDKPVIVHEIRADERTAVQVTVTLFARVISIREEG